MSLWVDAKYANQLGSRLRNFKHRGGHLWNASCAVCGDSKTNLRKARMFIYKSKTALFVKCHNCGYSTNLGNFIKHVDPVMYEEYVLENYKESGAPRSPHKSAEVAIPKIISRSEIGVDSILDPVKRLDTLRPTHPALEYIRKRKIPTRFYSLLYFAPRFKQFVNTVVPGKFKNLEDDHPRLIIPYFNSHGKCFAFQGRAFGKEEPKYYTIKVDDTEEKIFGLDRINYSKRVYVTEGPLDSLFIPNAIAVSGSSFISPTIEALKTNATIVFDREPGSQELTKLIKRTIDVGFSVCLLPNTMPGKDINEYILSGMAPEQILDAIDAHTYTGIRASLEFARWKRV